MPPKEQICTGFRGETEHLLPQPVCSKLRKWRHPSRAMEATSSLAICCPLANKELAEREKTVVQMSRQSFLFSLPAGRMVQKFEFCVVIHSGIGKKK